MQHSIEVNSYMGLVAVTLCGEVSATDRLRVLDETLGRLEADRGYGILIDLQRARATPGTFEACNRLTTRLAEEPRLRGCRLAYVDSEPAAPIPWWNAWLRRGVSGPSLLRRVRSDRLAAHAAADTHGCAAGTLGARAAGKAA